MNYSELGFSNNFMFGKIMENQERCKAFLEQILDFKIDHIEYIEREKIIDEKFDGRSIRMDIYVDDGKTIYNCEMQTTNEGNLAKRSRYYQSQIDMSLLQRGENFRKLKRSYVIFICTFDPIGYDQCKYMCYTMTICDGRPVIIEDEAIKVFINTKGTKGIRSEAFAELLKFIDSSEDRIYQNELANDLLEDLKKAQSNVEWRHEYMTWETLKEDCREEGRIEGLAKGLEQGLAQGREEGLSLGREEGLSQGREQEILQSVIEEDYSIERGAEKLGISVEELREKIKQL